jgi:putative salt-induced outer membrane protein YdiY
MTTRWRGSAAAPAAALLAGMLLTTEVILAQEPEEGGGARSWTNNTELSLVSASGNSTATTFGFRNVYAYKWARSRLSWETGMVRADSRDGDRYAVGFSPDDFELIVPPTKIDSQRLFSKLGYRQEIRGAHFWFGNFDSTRDESSNINRQFVGAGGFGTRWADREQLNFRTEYGISYTSEDLDLEGENHFGGYRLSYGLDAGVTANTTIESGLTFDGSFQQRDDIRTDWLNGVSVSLNSRIALKSSLRLIFRNIPALEDIDLETPVLGVVIGKVNVSKEKLDTSFTTSLVITF